MTSLSPVPAEPKIVNHETYARTLLFPRYIYHINFVKITLRESGQKRRTDTHRQTDICTYTSVLKGVKETQEKAQ